ncbi:hypothetical protein RUM44_010065 [Polyplax serrata]|uniref:PPM-type phosphatase domain-containing protein n=1 Tax=Polyplax serrata TaxID=468196 RepID=A0ABR1AW98_POLSC
MIIAPRIKLFFKERDRVYDEKYKYTRIQENADIFADEQKINNLLQANEFTKEFGTGCSIKSYDTNQLPSNDPMEDTRTEAHCIHNNGYLFGVFDGHGGGSCAQVVAKRLFHYITAFFLNHQQLLQLSESISSAPDNPLKTLNFYNEKFEFVDVLRNLYTKSYHMFINELIESNATDNLSVENILERSFLRLDADISREATESVTNVAVHPKAVSVAMSGAVSCVAYISGPHLYVASAGDCQAVVGTLGDNEQWTPKVLSVQHNSENIKEVNRIIKEHPQSEKETVIKGDRLLGHLAPLRAFGDFRYKWSGDVLDKIAGPFYGSNAKPADYHTPPYLTAKPDVTYHHLTVKDKFLVLATDGLWDFISPQQVVRMVGEHMRGKSVLTPFSLPKENLTLGEINEALLFRNECLTMKPIDTNVCTHLLRNALGGTEYGLDHGRLSQYLSLPQEVVRGFRDDISITVVYFDPDYLRLFMPDVK